MLGALRNLAAAQRALPEGRAIAGYHIEGPHISAEDGPRGAHPARWVRRPDLEEYRRWQDATGGQVKLVTLAPEWPEAPAYIAALVRDGVAVSIGHTGATREQIAAAVDAGARLSTHLGNGAHKVLPRHPNYVWEQLAEDRLSASFIVDGLHLSDTFLRVALRAKTVARSVLVTDAVAPAMCAPGGYMLGEVEVELKPDERVVLRGGDRLAGSSLRMDRAIENVLRLGVRLEDAVTMATTNPGALCGIESNGSTRFACENGRMRILETELAGEVVYKA
jgi:N-acetylglucosamine-6-phosphate deacetylase